MIAASHPDFEMHLVGVGGVPAHYVGSDAASASSSETWLRPGNPFRFEATDIRDLGERVLVLADVRACGRESGVEVDDRWAWIIEVSGGRAASLHGYLDQREALEAAGISQ